MRPVTNLLRVGAIAVALVALGAAGCGGGDETKDAFEQDVVAARDTADSAFANIRRPTSTKDLIRRLRLGQDRIATASGTIAVAEAPEELAEEQRSLSGALDDLSQEFDAAANSIELVQSGPAGQRGQVETLIFENWDTVQAALDDLRKAGIEVRPLRRGGGA